MKWARPVLSGCGILLLVLLVLTIALGWLIDSGSTRTIYQRAKSPDGWHEARVQFDDAGALSSFSRLVFVKHTWNTSDEPLLSCRAFWGDGEAKVRLAWQDSRTLMIEHHFAPQNVKAVAQSCGPIRVIVRATPPFETD